MWKLIKPRPGNLRLWQLAVLVAANLLATAARFVLLRGWVFHPGRTQTGQPR